MKIDNLEKAKKLVMQLAECDEKLKLIVEERRELLNSSARATKLVLNISMDYFTLDKQEILSVLEILIMHYESLKRFLKEQIEAC